MCFKFLSAYWILLAMCYWIDLNGVSSKSSCLHRLRSLGWSCRNKSDVPVKPWGTDLESKKKRTNGTQKHASNCCKFLIVNNLNLPIWVTNWWMTSLLHLLRHNSEPAKRGDPGAGSKANWPTWPMWMLKYPLFSSFPHCSCWSWKIASIPALALI